MLKIENAVVAAMAAMDLVTAFSLLSKLIVLDRRRGWWAAFRVAGAQQPEERREAMIALVGKSYIARRTGRLVGTPEEDVLRILLIWMTAEGFDPSGRGLSDTEQRLLKSWLPGRLRTIPSRSIHTP